MNKATTPLIYEELSKHYPITGLMDGWYFRYDEISKGTYRIEGIDELGHSVARTCRENELDATLKACAREARAMEARIIV
ncbi:MAG: hypothetical protein JXB85_17875 [Anaerolineales bacterium]|nr:hypothetical protein [Anaerolineales bacterium]